MKTLEFYEINDSGSYTLPEMSENAGIVFDTINNKGAVTIKGLRRLVPGLSTMELSQALGELRNAGVIVRRNLEAHDTD